MTGMGSRALFRSVERKGVLAWKLNLLRLTHRLWEVFDSTLVCKCWLQNAPTGCGNWSEGASFAFLLLGQQFNLQSGCVRWPEEVWSAQCCHLLTDKK